MRGGLEFLCVIRRVFQLGTLELHLPFENLAVIFDKPQGAVEVDVRSRPPQQTFVFESLDVGKVAQRREPKRFQEFLRGDIGEGRAGFGRAQNSVDEIETF